MLSSIKFSGIGLIAGFAMSSAILLAACGDENTTTVNEFDGFEALAKGETLPECTEAMEGKMVYVADSAAVYYCADNSWAALNGQDGQDGQNGKDGKDGQDGQDGENGDDGTSCSAKSIAEGIEVSCGGVVVDTIVNGKDGKDGQDGQDGENGDDGDDGTSCTAKSISEGVEVSCGGVVVDTIVNGKDGKDGQDGQDGENGDDGTSCSAKSIAEGVEVSCGGVVVDTIVNGKDGKDGQDGQDGAKGDKGDAGASCTAKSISEGVEVSCGGVVVDTIANGQDGAKGDKGDEGTSCTATTIAEGVEVSCGGVVVDTIANGQDGAKGNKGDDCSLTDNGDGTVSVTCGEDTTILYKAVCGTKAYDPAVSFCFEDSLYSICGNKSYNPEKEYCLTLKDEDDNEISKIESLLIDSRDNQVYKTVAIGSQIWMAQNLNYADSVATPSLQARSWCYENSVDSCAKYGRLYTWAAAIDSVALANDTDNPQTCGYGKKCTLPDTVQGICPEGWHLPSGTEWSSLFVTVGGKDYAGKLLKSTSGWGVDHDSDGMDAYGFSALPAGYSFEGDFSAAGNYACFWSSTEYNSEEVYFMLLVGYADRASLDGTFGDLAFSVRCLKD